MMKALIEMITHLSALFPVLSSWESCALNLIEKHRPSTVYFICKTADQCPRNSVYRMIMNTPSQTLFGLGTHELPALKKSDLIFFPIHEDNIEWNNETIQKYRFGGNNFFKIVVVASMRNTSQGDNESMSRLFADMWKSGVVYGAVLLKNNDTSLLFTYIPFSSSGSCEDTNPIMIGECDAAANNIFDDTNKIINLNKCPLRVSFAEDKPWFQIEPFIGRYKALLEELSYRMNFTAELITPSDHTVNGGICGPEEFTGTKGDVANGKAHFAVGNFHKRECSTMLYIMVPYTTCLAWCTPLITAKDYIFTYLVGLFQPKAWIALILTIFVFVISVIVLCNWTSDRVVGNDVIYLILVVFAPVPLHYRSTSIRFVLGMWLLTCVVVRTAYEGELKSQSAVPLQPQVIRSLDGIVERVRKKKFKKLCSTGASLQVLKTINEPNIQYLYKRAQTCSDGMHNNILAAALKGDRVIFTTDQRCRVAASEIQENWASLVHPSTGGCTKLIQIAPTLTYQGSPFRDTIDRIQHRSFDSGLYFKWTDVKMLGKAQKEGLRPLSINNVLPAMFVLFLGCGIGFFTLLVEVLFYSGYRFRLKVTRLIRQYNVR